LDWIKKLDNVVWIGLRLRDELVGGSGLRSTAPPRNPPSTLATPAQLCALRAHYMEDVLAPLSVLFLRALWVPVPPRVGCPGGACQAPR
jgi:hypothetical protein